MKSRALDTATGQFVSSEAPPKRPPGRPKGSVKKKLLLETLSSPLSAAEKNTIRKISKGKKAVAEDSLFELSVTIATGSQDIDPALLENVHKFLVERACSGKCSLERGGAAYHLRLQMVLRILAKSVVAVSKQLKAYLGWSNSPPPGASVMCKKLSNKGMHSFQGMLAYCMKDADKEHYATVEHNILSSDVQQGLELYSLFGKEENKKRVALTTTNFVDKVFRWRRFNCKHPLVIDFEQDLYDMIRSGKYYPAMSWVVGGYGRGYEPYRMQSLYRIVVSPETATRFDVSNVFHTPEAWRQDRVPRRVWFAGRFQSGAEDHSSEKVNGEKMSRQDINDLEAANAASKAAFSTMRAPIASDILVHTPKKGREILSRTATKLDGCASVVQRAKDDHNSKEKKSF